MQRPSNATRRAASVSLARRAVLASTAQHAMTISRAITNDVVVWLGGDEQGKSIDMLKAKGRNHIELAADIAGIVDARAADYDRLRLEARIVRERVRYPVEQ